LSFIYNWRAKAARNIGLGPADSARFGSAAYVHSLGCVKGGLVEAIRKKPHLKWSGDHITDAEHQDSVRAFGPRYQSLVEPLLRRTTFLSEVVAALGLSNVEVVRARAEELHGSRTFDVVTSRAVAPMNRLSAWSLPLVRSGGEFLAMKGSSVQDEVDAAASAISAGHGVLMGIVELGGEVLDPPVRIVRIVKE